MISSKDLKNAIFAAAENIEKHADEVNNLNVFPVPDGDTGTNLSLTLSGCAKAIANCNEENAGALASLAAGELLRCARGNSGVIFSLIFKGFAQSVANLREIDAAALANGLEAGCNEAYAAIDKPTEGTMLTIIRIAASKASNAAQKGKTAKETLADALSGARASLKSTPNLLPILKKHGVVDAGGQGLVYIIEGMLGSPSETVLPNSATKKLILAPEIEFIYCTEFLINQPKEYSMENLKKFFADIGDCPAVAAHSDFIKIHVHTNSPDKALEKGLELGELSSIKIDNMKLQSEQKENCLMISLCSGGGIKKLLEENGGVNALECSGSMNASAGDILEAVNQCRAENIFISPNNKNTVLAAQRAAVMSGKKVWVNSAKTIPEGIAAARVFNPQSSPEENISKMDKSSALTLSGAVTYAAKSGSYGGQKFSQGQIIGIENGEVVCSGDDVSEAAVKISCRLAEKSQNKKVTLIYGKDTDRQNVEKVAGDVMSVCTDIEIEKIEGGQPLYYYIISAE